MVGRKQTSKNEDWLRLYDKCAGMYSKDETDSWAEQAIMELHRLLDTHGLDKTRVGFCWSGGKDSEVMYDVLKRSGLPLVDGLCVLHQNEYPSFEAWLMANAPAGTIYKRSTAFSLEYLNKHTEYLFPVESKTIGAYTADWRKELKQYFDEQNLSVVVKGHRKIDGNFCATDKMGFHYTKRSDGLAEYSPIADWSHGQVLAYIHHHDLKLPHIYFWPNGFRFGTHQWTERRRLNGSYKDTFDEIMQIEPEALYGAADRLDLAKQYLEGKL